jgi:hypothetical protein
MFHFRRTHPRSAAIAITMIALIPAAGAIGQVFTKSSAFGPCLSNTGNAQHLGCNGSLASELPPQGVADVGMWRLVRTPHPRGGADMVSIIHTADTLHSDLDLAGLSIRCSDKGVEALLVVLEPRSPRTQPQVRIGAGSVSAVFVSSVVTPFSLILLPPDAATLITGPWKSLPDLSVQIDSDGSVARGIVQLAGLPAALQLLNANCATR